MSIIGRAFSREERLYKRILQAINENPSQETLFQDIATFHLKHTQGGLSAAAASEPASKKRKLDNGVAPIPVTNTKSETVLELREVSFTIPQRKKLHFRIVRYGSDSSTASLGCQAVNPATNAVEYELPSTDLAYIIRTPVPEKATKQYNFIFVPRATSTHEPILFTLPATPLKGGTYTFPSGTLTTEDALKQVLQTCGLSLTLPDEKEFASATPESHRKNEKAFHVKAFRGSKDGFLFFLSNGIFFGFKKPLLFLPFDCIESISYTSVLQRTFNLSVTFRKTGAEDSDEEEIEFSMLDQSDYSGINDYVQRHGLNDASLAAGRRAKVENKKRGTTNGEAADDANGDDGRTELERAEAELQDEEDEMEEDFEPSDDDDDGSGSEESDDEDNDNPRKDLVQDELGSEAEDVEITDDEEDEGEAELEEEENVDAEEEQAVPPQVVVQQKAQPVSQGRWGASINTTPDPEDNDQL